MQNKTYWTTKPPLQIPPSTSKATTPKVAPSQKKKQNNSHAKAAASERSVREHQEAGIQFENIAHNRQALATLTAEQDKWRNPSLHPELRQEAYEEFKKTAEGAQDYFNFGSFSLRAKQQETLPSGLPLYEGYHINKFGHGEISDLNGLADFISGNPVGIVASGTYAFSRDFISLSKIIASGYIKGGKTELNINGIGKVLLNQSGVKDSIAHYGRNNRTYDEHKQRVTDAFALVPDVLEKGCLVEYGQQVDNPQLYSYIFLAPVQIGAESCVMAVRVRKATGQEAKFYLHGVELLDALKTKAQGLSHFRDGSNKATSSDGTDPRDVFRLAKKALAVKQNNADPKRKPIPSHCLKNTVTELTLPSSLADT